MKKIVFFISIFLLISNFISCISPTKLEIQQKQTIDNLNKKIDSISFVNSQLTTGLIYAMDSVRILNNESQNYFENNIILSDSIKNHVCVHKMTYEDQNNAFTLEKIKYYIKICDNKPSNKKFFFGWIKRAMRN